MQVTILNDKQCRSRSVGFFWSQLIWICTVFKGRVYSGSAGPGWVILCRLSKKRRKQDRRNIRGEGREKQRTRREKRMTIQKQKKHYTSSRLSPPSDPQRWDSDLWLLFLPFILLGPVVQNLQSQLVETLIIKHDIYANIFAEKKVSSFCISKSYSHLFSAKIPVI